MPKLFEKDAVALRRAGTALAVEECVTPDENLLSDESTMLRRISLPGG